MRKVHSLGDDGYTLAVATHFLTIYQDCSYLDYQGTWKDRSSSLRGRVQDILYDLVLSIPSSWTIVQVFGEEISTILGALEISAEIVVFQNSKSKPGFMKNLAANNAKIAVRV